MCVYKYVCIYIYTCKQLMRICNKLLYTCKLCIYIYIYTYIHMLVFKLFMFMWIMFRCGRM